MFKKMRFIPLFALALSLLSCVSTSKEGLKLAEAHYKLGLSHLNEGEHQSAFIEFQRALDLDKKNKEIHNAIGIVYLKMDDLAYAEEAFKKAVSLDKDYADAYNNLCFVYLKRKLYEEAVSYCMTATGKPLYATPEKAFYNTGISYYRLGRYAEAAEAFEKALKRSPSFYPAYYSLALSYNGMAMYGKASTALGSAIDLDPLFHGDRKKAENYLTTKKLEGQEAEDLRNLLEILKY